MTKLIRIEFGRIKDGLRLSVLAELKNMLDVQVQLNDGLSPDSVKLIYSDGTYTLKEWLRVKA